MQFNHDGHILTLDVILLINKMCHLCLASELLLTTMHSSPTCTNAHYVLFLTMHYGLNTTEIINLLIFYMTHKRAEFLKIHW